MKRLPCLAASLTLACLAAPSGAQNANSVQFPAGYAPGQSICVKQPDGSCVPVSAASPLPVSGGAGGGGGDASAANQVTQIATEQAIQSAIGVAAASPATNTIGDRLKTGNASLASIDADIGVTTDTVAASDTGTASLIALTKRLNQGVTTLNTAATPAGTNIIGRVGIDQSTPGTTNAVVVTGNMAAGAADSGNPVKVGAVFNNTLPTYTTGQRGDLQMTNRGTVLATISDGASSAAVGSYSSDGIAGGSTVGVRALSYIYGLNAGGQADRVTVRSPSDGATFVGPAINVASTGSIFNGSAWDRVKKPSAVARIASAAASTNATSAKASAGDVTMITALNAGAQTRYLKLYNKASAPVVGTDTPFYTLALAPGSTILSFPNGGLYFSTGIAFAMTQSELDSDTTALAAGEVRGLNIAYQ